MQPDDSAEKSAPLRSDETTRILQAYSRRAGKESAYAPWRIDAAYLRAERTWLAAKMLREVNAFPDVGSKCLEIGYGTMGWLADLVSWGVPTSNLFGIELDPDRVARAVHAFPRADLRVGDASKLPWPDESFDLVVMSTVLSSVLDQGMRQAIAADAQRVLRTNGVLLWYDMRRNNPWNSDVRKVTKSELRVLFPRLTGPIQSVTLAPPIVRALAPRSIPLVTGLAWVPILRTHLMAVLRKSSVGSRPRHQEGPNR